MNGEQSIRLYRSQGRYLLPARGLTLEAMKACRVEGEVLVEDSLPKASLWEEVKEMERIWPPPSRSGVTGKRHSRVARHQRPALIQGMEFSYGSADTSRQLPDGL